ncbi:AraC family transcriptional regulator [Allokutzneria oryzae]|uniref:Helix-turn-helix domain-containing protein n=1 Tax=Allokutzneria oryzae TaxID=1378989 RepID=A0ABV5ZTB9_9PSEU
MSFPFLGLTSAIIASVDNGALPETCCPAGEATLWLWPGHALYLGPSLRLDTHSGSVHCFALGVDAPFGLRAGETGERRVRSALVTARTPHRIVAERGRMLFCYLDRADGVRSRMTEHHSSIHCGHRDESSLIRYLDRTPVPDPLWLLDFLRGGAAGRIDERIVAAMRAIRADPAAELSAARLAAEANLSTSRFLHLFSASTETSFRRYRLWARMLRVAESVREGHSLTRASTDAGFASPGHFSDTFHAMFGLTATAFFAAGARIVPLDRPAASSCS